MTRRRSESGERGKRKGRRRATAAGIAVAGALGFGGWFNGDKSGEVAYYPQSSPHFETIDNTTVGLSLNIHRSMPRVLPKFLPLVDEHRPDFIGLQEVTPRDERLLRRQFDDWHITRVAANTRLYNQSNVIMTRQKPREIETMVMGRPDALETGLRLGRAAMRTTKNFLTGDSDVAPLAETFQESRASMALTIPALTSSGAPTQVRIVNGHISPHLDFRQRQLEENVQFFEETAGRAETALFCGDFNARPSVIWPLMSEAGFYTWPTRPTSVTSGDTIDYCFAGHGTPMQVEVLDDVGSDHLPVLVQIKH